MVLKDIPTKPPDRSKTNEPLVAANTSTVPRDEAHWFVHLVLERSANLV